MGGLLNKLRRMEIEQDLPSSQPSQSVDPGIWHETYHFPLSLFSEPLSWTPESYFTAFHEAPPTHADFKKILFLDTETTGLSGGAGTLAFQIGVGYFTKTEFLVEQFLIYHYGQERMMLQKLSVLLSRFPLLCTFNGRTFDVPLLISRFNYHKLDVDCFPDAHADVLFPARQIWKLRLQSCSLSHLENELLGIEREDDLPGELVPGVYFRYQKDGHFEPLMKVLEHNRQDVISLTRLYFYLLHQIASPEKIEDPRDLFSLARSQQRHGEMAGAVENYERLCGTSLSAKGHYALARRAKQEGRYEEALCHFEAMLDTGCDEVTALEELAKLYEHQFKQPETAMQYTRKALAILSEPVLRSADPAIRQRQQELRHRYNRLKRIISD